MKLLLIGDPHFKKSNAIESEQFHTEIQNLLKNREIDRVIILGDTLDTHNVCHIEPYTRACKFITSIAELKKTYLIIGNHDRKNNNVFLSDESFFSGMKHINNLTVVDNVFYEEDINCLFVPYVPNGKFKEAIKNFDHHKCKYIFAHQEFKGCKMGAFTSVSGDEYSEVEPQVYSGHIHEYSIPQKNIVYPGTPFSHGFNDVEDKYVLILDYETNTYEKIILDIVKKLHLKLTVEEFDDMELPKNVILKITFEGDGILIRKRLMEEKRLKRLKNIKYIIKNTVKATKKEFTKIHNTFEEQLRYRIKRTTPDVIEEFNELFL